ncbi:MAG: hypothetical protein AB7G13_09085 [Lautropia sp.]
MHHIAVRGEIMPDSSALSSQPIRSRGAVNLILFSRENCPFCRIVREHYLRPLLRQRVARLFISEIDIDGRQPVTGWNGEPLTQASFARAHRMTFSPTVALFDARGLPLAEPIVGLSNDYFGAYLDAAVARALAAPG